MLASNAGRHLALVPPTALPPTPPNPLGLPLSLLLLSSTRFVARISLLLAPSRSFLRQHTFVETREGIKRRHAELLGHQHTRYMWSAYPRRAQPTGTRPTASASSKAPFPSSPAPCLSTALLASFEADGSTHMPPSSPPQSRIRTQSSSSRVTRSRTATPCPHCRSPSTKSTGRVCPTVAKIRKPPFPLHPRRSALCAPCCLKRVRLPAH